MRVLLVLALSFCLLISATTAGAESTTVLSENFNTVTGVGGGPFLTPPGTFGFTTDWDTGISNDGAYGGVFGGATVVDPMSADGLTAGGVNGTGAGRLFVEDVDITSGNWFAGLQFKTGPLPGSTPLLNQGFEANGGSLDSWSTFGNVFADLSNPPGIVPRRDSTLCKMYGQFAGDSGIYQDLPAEEGQVWTLDCFARHNTGDALTGTPNFVIMTLDFLDSGSSPISTNSSAAILDSSSTLNTWIDAPELEATAPVNTAFVRAQITFVQPPPFLGVGHIDDVRLRIKSGPNPVNLSSISMFVDALGQTVGAGSFFGNIQLRVEDTYGSRLLFDDLADGSFRTIGGALSTATEADANENPAAGVFNSNAAEYLLVVAFENNGASPWGDGGSLTIDNLLLGPQFVDIGAALTPIEGSSVAWGDYDNDGDLDILLTGVDSGLNRVAEVYENTAGTFTDIGAGLTGVSESSVAWGDYDNDGDLDILLTGRDSGNNRVAKVYENTAGTFTDIGAGLTGVLASSVAWGDYDNDGDLDILLTGWASGNNPVAKVYENTGGTFTDIGAGLTGVLASSVAWGDYDNDGDLDILLTGLDSGFNPVAKVYENTGGTFTNIGVGLTGVSESSVAWGDYDNDGDLDILLTGWDSGSNPVAKVYENTGGTFTDIGAGLTGVERNSVAWGDYDNDGDLDILLTGRDSGLNPVAEVYENTGGTFTDIGAGLTGVAFSSVAWGDYDNDSDLDILLTGWDSSNPMAKVYENCLPQSNTPPNAPGNLNATWGQTGVTFTWDPATDPETSSAGLSYNLIVGTNPGGLDVLSAMADGSTGYRRVVALGGVNQNTSWTLQPSGVAQLYWSVQAVDAAFAGSPFATEQLVTPPVALQSVSDIAPDQGGNVRLSVLSSPLDDAGEPTYPVSLYNLWRRVDSPPMAAGIRRLGTAIGVESAVGEHVRLALNNGFDVRKWEDRFFFTPSATGVAPAFPPGTWEITGSFAATQQSDYLVAAQTLADSTETNGIFWSVFVVTAHTTTPSIWYMSDPDSGYSVDNIAPGVPGGFAAASTPGGVTLTWNPAPEPDFQYFRIYRDTDPGFVPDPMTNLVHETAATSWVDSPGDPGSVFYKLVSVDHAGNPSGPAASGAVTGIGDGPRIPTAFALRSAVPNPLHASTRIAFALPEESLVSLEVFDVAGRHVRRIVRGTMPAGAHTAVWDGTDESGRQASAGVYLYRLRAGNFESTQRMVMIR